MKIEQAERQFGEKLQGPLNDALNQLGYSVPTGYEQQIKLKDAQGRKKRSDASAENWSPESGQIVIKFKPAARPTNETRPDRTPTVVHGPTDSIEHGESASVHPAEAELLRVLDQTESRPGWSFVPLKKFRDEILPLEHCPSIRTDVERHHMLRSAIEKKLIVVGKVPNPKAPQFPVTTIRVNRLLPQVKTVLGSNEDSKLAFRPVEIVGEPLSATVLRERR